MSSNLIIALIGVAVLLILLIKGMNIGICMMFMGWFTANEAAAVGATAALVYLIIRRKFTWKIFKGVAPMVLGMCVAIFIVCAIPDIALFLPRLLGYIS